MFQVHISRLGGPASRNAITLGSFGIASPLLERSDSAPSLSLARPADLFERSELDLVSLSRAALSDAAWTREVRDRQLNEIRPYDENHESQPL